MTPGPRVISLSDRADYRPDLGELARRQVAAARASIEASPDEFAELLSPLLGWAPSAEAVKSWESVTVPPGDVLVAASLLSQGSSDGQSEVMDLVSRFVRDRYADLAGVFPNANRFHRRPPAAGPFRPSRDH
jgi:hypothetical protein